MITQFYCMSFTVVWREKMKAFLLLGKPFIDHPKIAALYFPFTKFKGYKIKSLEARDLFSWMVGLVFYNN